MSVQISTRLGYNYYFNDKPLDFKDYFSGVSKEIIYKSVAYLVNLANPRHKNHSAQQMINVWFSSPNHELKKELLAKTSSKDSIVNISSSLKLVEFVIQNTFDEEQTLSEAEFEINLFKAYLLLNLEQDKLEKKGYATIPEEVGSENLLGLIIAMNYHDYDLINYNLKELIIIQFIKSIEYFKYLESREELHSHLHLFLAKYNCSTWEEWLTNFLAIIFPVLEQNIETAYFDFTIPEDENFEYKCQFFDSFILSENANYKLSDYIAIRANPILKIEKGLYRILYQQFFIWDKKYIFIQVLRQKG